MITKSIPNSIPNNNIHLAITILFNIQYTLNSQTNLI